MLDDPEIEVSGVEDEGMHGRLGHPVNMVHETDKFIGDLIEMLRERDEPTIVVMFGDHLPTMGPGRIGYEQTGTLFKTQYATWNNFWACQVRQEHDSLSADGRYPGQP